MIVAKAKPKERDYAAELQKSFDRWDDIKINGCSDPFHTDGTNLRLVRNHIIVGKRYIEENMPPEQYPKIYYRETPPETDQNYMARVDEIQAGAKKSLELYKNDTDYKLLLNIINSMSDKLKKETSICAVLGYVSNLEKAISCNDLITMRRHERANRYMGSFASCVERIYSLNPPQYEQLSLI
jgi:hypothetical protein